MKDCLFCKIVQGDIPAKTIYEDDIAKVFLDIEPNTNGDLLIVTKKHQENLLEIDEEFITHAYRLAKEKLYPLLKEKLNCDGLTIVQNNFYGPMVQHFHFHLTPRYKNDEYKEISNKDLLEDLDEIYAKLTK